MCIGVLYSTYKHGGTMAEKKQLMTIEDFIEEYSISRTFFYYELKKGNLRITKIGRRTYIKRQHADDWLNSIGVD